MAESLAHRWGQVVGELFETAFHSFLAEIASRAGVYLDFNGNKRPSDLPVRNNRGKLAWRDSGGNWHQLDYVYERGGANGTVGVPAAFVELAWRRYTKHSKNKAQEIEGALLPLAETYREARPFLGAIVGGVFTANSLDQLSSRGFICLYVPYKKIVAAFAEAGIHASYDESTPEQEYATKLAKFKALTAASRRKIQCAILASVSEQTSAFVTNLLSSLSRRVSRITVLPLYGEPVEMTEPSEAIAWVSHYPDAAGAGSPLVRYEIEVQYTNGAVVRGSYPTKAEAISFLRSIS